MSTASAFDLLVTIFFHPKLLPEDDHVVTSHFLSNGSVSQLGDGGWHVFTGLFKEFPLRSGTLELNVRAQAVPSLEGGDVMNCSVKLDYYSSPKSSNCSQRSYMLPATAFPDTCARNLVVTSSVHDNTGAVVQRVAPGQSAVLRVSSVVQDIGRQQMTVFVTVEHLNLTGWNMSDIWHVIDVRPVSNKSVS